MLPFEGRTLGLDPESLSPADMLEARTNGILVWYLDQLALLVDQSVALLEEVAAKNAEVALQSEALQQRGVGVAAELASVKSAVKEPGFVNAYVNAAVVVPQPPAPQCSAKQAAEVHEKLALDRQPQEQALLPEEWTPLRCRFSPAPSPSRQGSPAPERPSPLRSPLHSTSRPARQLALDDSSAAAATKPSPLRSRPSHPAPGPSHRALSDDSSGFPAVPQLPQTQQRAKTDPDRSENRRVGDNVAVAEAVMVARKEVEQPATSPTKLATEFIRGLEHLLPSAPTLPPRLTVEVEAVMAPAVMPTGDESAAHNEPHDESAAVAVTCNPLYLASLDAASSLPQGALRQLTQQLPTQDENVRSEGQASAVSISARSDSQSPVAKRKSAELDAIIASRVQSSPAGTASEVDVQIAVLDNGIERTDTMEGQLLPFGQDPADFTTLSFRFLPAVQRLGPSASAGQDTDFSPLGAAAAVATMPGWQPPVDSEGPVSQPGSPAMSARSMQSVSVIGGEVPQLAPLGESIDHFQGSLVGGGPTFMRTNRPGSPILPAELLLREGPLSGGGHRLAGEACAPAESSRLPAWGQSRYVLPGGGTTGTAAAGAWRFHDRPPRITPSVSPQPATDWASKRREQHAWMTQRLDYNTWSAQEPQENAWVSHEEDHHSWNPPPQHVRSHSGGWKGGRSPTKPPPLQTHRPRAASPTLPPPLPLENNAAAGNALRRGADWEAEPQSPWKGNAQPWGTTAASGLSRGAMRASWGEESLALSAFGNGGSGMPVTPRSGHFANDRAWDSRTAVSSAISSPTTSPVQAPSPSGKFPRRFGLAPIKAGL